MRHLQNWHGKSLAVVTLSTLVTLIAMAFGGLGRSATELAAQAFQSPIETPTPTPSPTPIPPSPTPPGPSAEAQLALNYVATAYGLAPENLRVANEHRRDYPLLGRAFRAVVIYDAGGSGFYHLLVDLADGRVETDVAAIERAATLALRARHGRLHPTLYERLQQIGDDEELSVAIWSEARPVRSQAQLYAELARRFPAAAAALARSGVPFDVGDPALADQIRDAYVQLLTEDTAVQVRPLVQHLQSRGVSVQMVDGVPTVAARLSKRLILALNQRADVAMIFLIEEPAQAVMNVANQTTLVAQVRDARGLTGAGQRIAILEPGTIVPTDQCLPSWRIPWVRVAGNDPTGHKTRVANVAACNDTRFGGAYTGVASAAEVIDAGVSDTDQVDALRALKFATDPDRHAHVVNVSAVWGQSRSVEWIDKAFDWLARQRSVVIVAGAGNRQPPNDSLNVGTPAKGWNVLAVGAFDDHNTPSWHDDTMWPDSAYLNPLYYAATRYDREKPELVAPGVDITMISTDGNTYSGPGTSFAAPQVAGMAALLMERNPALQQAAEAVRAILMASAVHNIEGDPGIPSGQELQDGAGSVNAALADTIAQTRWTSDASPCPGSCWYQIPINPNYPSTQSPLQRYFSAGAGNLVRVVISWWSYANADEGSYPVGIDQLITNLNLEVRDPDGQAVEGGYSASWDNNYEMVHFIAPKTGTYTIRVLREPTGYDEDNVLGIGVARVYRTMLPTVLRGN